MLPWRPKPARQWPGESNTQADAQTSKRRGKMGVTDSSDVQNIKQPQKMNKTRTLTDGEMQSVKVRRHYIKGTTKQHQLKLNN